MRARIICVVFVGLVLRATAASAAEPDAREAAIQKARQHFIDGKKAFEARDYPAALREFQAGYDLEPRPGFLLNMGHAARKMGDLARARDYYHRFLQTNPSGEELRTAQESMAEIDRQLGQPRTDTVPPPGGGAAGGAPPAVTGGAGTTPEPVGAAGTGTPPTGSGDGQPAGGGAVKPLPGATDPAATSGTIASAPVGSAALGPHDPEQKPLYKQWWLWTAVGVVAAGTAAVLIYSATRSSDTFHDMGTWGSGHF